MTENTKKNLCRPYRECKPHHLTQGWSPEHRGFDFGYKYGTWLVALENSVVENIMTAENWDKGWELERGYGILLRSIRDPNFRYTYWHTLPFFPVKKGEIVLKGQPVAQLGNSGFVLSGGKPVLLKDRLKPPYHGSHIHISAPQNLLEMIDWELPIKFDILTTISLTLFSISNFLKKNKI